MIAFIVLALIAFALLALFVPSIRASAARKAGGDNAEVLHSKWRDWNGDGTTFPGWNGSDVDPAFASDDEIIEPPSGTIRIQAR